MKDQRTKGNIWGFWQFCCLLFWRMMKQTWTKYFIYCFFYLTLIVDLTDSLFASTNLPPRLYSYHICASGSKYPHCKVWKVCLGFFDGNENSTDSMQIWTGNMHISIAQLTYNTSSIQSFYQILSMRRLKLLMKENAHMVAWRAWKCVRD